MIFHGVIMLIIDGAEASDYEYCKNINRIKNEGSFGRVDNTPEGRETGSLSCIMNILGVPKENIPSGRAYLEAVSENISIDENDLIFRCNNVEIKDNKLVSSCGEFKGNEIKGFINSEYRLVHMGSYKNLFIVKNSKKFIDSIKTYPPHENIGADVNEILPKCDNKFIEDILRNLITNYKLFPWGQSKKEYIPSFEEIHNKKGAVVCKTEIVKGIAKAMKMHCPDIKGSTADVDTKLKEKAEAALELSKKYDFVLLHINGSDESAHRRNLKEKLDFIKKIDSEVVEYIAKSIDKDTSFIITSDHGTSAESGSHVKGLVNYYILNEDKEARLWLKQ